MTVGAVSSHDVTVITMQTNSTTSGEGIGTTVALVSDAGVPTDSMGPHEKENEKSR